MDSQTWEAFDNYIRSPPGILMALAVTGLVGLAMAKIVKVAKELAQFEGALVGSFEIFAIVVPLYVVLKKYIWDTVETDNHAVALLDHPLLTLLVFIATVFLSMVLYSWVRKKFN